MPLVLLFVAVVLLVAAYNNTQGTLARQLATDVTGFATWFAAVAAVGALQWIPGFEKLARWLIGLILLVIVLRNYQQIFKGFTDLGTASGPAPAVADPAAAYISNPNNPQITQASVTGTGNINAGNQQPTIASSPYAPQSLVAQFEAHLPQMLMDASAMGFGGIS